MSGYLSYCKDNKYLINQTNPNATESEITKLFEKMWIDEPESVKRVRIPILFVFLKNEKIIIQLI